MEADILKICGMGVLCSVICAVIGKFVGGIGVAIRLGGLALVLGCAISFLGQISDTVIWIGDGVGGEYVSLMLKGLGVVTLGRVCADVCRDCGEGTLASAVETCVKLVVMLLALPSVTGILQSVEQLLAEV